jgi:predicted nucleotidyltransferase
MAVKRILREFKQEIIKVYGRSLKKIILYGSWARGQATSESDIDILLVLEGKIVPGKEIDRIIDIVSNINLKYGVLISVYPVSERKYLKTDSPLLLNIRREGIPA